MTQNRHIYEDTEGYPLGCRGFYVLGAVVIGLVFWAVVIWLIVRWVR